MLNWQLLVFISVVTNSVSVLLQKIILKDDKTDSVAFSIVFQIFTGLLILIYSLVRGFSVPDLIPLLPNLVLMTILYGAGNIFIFKALKTSEASQFTIIFATRTIWSIVAAIIFLGEGFTIKQLIGTGLILSSIVLVAWKDKLRLGKGSLLSLGAAAFFGLAFANDALIVRNFDVPSYMAIAFIVPALAVWAIFPQSTEKMKPMFNKEFLKKLGILGVFYAISALTIFFAYQIGRNAVQIAPLNQTSMILTVILAIIFLKEKSQLTRKLVGVILSFIGILLLR
jgi:drug/metabolite transporter (DMT)-like permease